MKSAYGTGKASRSKDWYCPVRKLHSETEKLKKKNNEISFVRHKYFAWDTDTQMYSLHQKAEYTMLVLD